MGKVLINVYIEDDQKAWLETLGKPAAVSVREAIEIYRSETGEPDEATRLAETIYPGMTKSALQQRIRQDWLYDRVSNGKRKKLDEVITSNAQIVGKIEKVLELVTWIAKRLGYNSIDNSGQG